MNSGVFESAHTCDRIPFKFHRWGNHRNNRCIPNNMVCVWIIILWSHFTEKEVIIRNVQRAIHRWTLTGVWYAIILFKFDKNNFEISVVESTDFLCIRMRRCFSEKTTSQFFSSFLHWTILFAIMNKVNELSCNVSHIEGAVTFRYNFFFVPATNRYQIQRYILFTQRRQMESNTCMKKKLKQTNNRMESKKTAHTHTDRELKAIASNQYR